MSRSGLRSAALTALLFSLQLFATQAMAVPFLVSVDTSVLNGTTGFLDLQLNPADSATPAALASVMGFGGNLGLLAGPAPEGDVTGTLPGALQLRNSTVFNSYFQAVQFGDLFSFIVDFTGDFLTSTAASGSSFSVSLFDDGLLPQLTNDVSGSLLRFELLAGNVTFQAFAANGRVAATVAPVALPGSASLFAAGMMLLLGSLLRRRYHG